MPICMVLLVNLLWFIHHNKTSEKCYSDFYAYSDNLRNLLLQYDAISP